MIRRYFIPTEPAPLATPDHFCACSIRLTFKGHTYSVGMTFPSDEPQGRIQQALQNMADEIMIRMREG